MVFVISMIAGRGCSIKAKYRAVLLLMMILIERSDEIRNAPPPRGAQAYKVKTTQKYNANRSKKNLKYEKIA